MAYGVIIQYSCLKKYVVDVQCVWKTSSTLGDFFASFMQSIFGKTFSNLLVTCSKELVSSSVAGWRMENGTSLTLFRMSLFGTAHKWVKQKGSLLPKIGHIYSTMMKLGTVIL